MNSHDLMAAAQSLDEAAIDLMAHALGWPKLSVIRQDRKRSYGRVKWALPHRIYYCTSPLGPEPSDLLDRGLIKIMATGLDGECTWTVTTLGQRVLQVRLMAEFLEDTQA